MQEAVATCIAPLIPAIKPQAPAILEKLMTQLLEHDNFGMRRGAAYGVSGVVKGLGVLALKQQSVIATLEAAIENKKNPRHREGALMAYELLCLRLGRVFEPYIMNLLPNLLVCYGDSNKDVRTAAEEAARAIMSTISSHGVKMVLPALLKALEDNSWRTKLGSVELLGAMAFLAPKQLSASLPKIVPPLRNVLSDSHNKVQQVPGCFVAVPACSSSDRCVRLQQNVRVPGSACVDGLRVPLLLLVPLFAVDTTGWLSHIHVDASCETESSSTAPVMYAQIRAFRCPGSLSALATKRLCSRRYV